MYENLFRQGLKAFIKHLFHQIRCIYYKLYVYHHTTCHLAICNIVNGMNFIFVFINNLYLKCILFLLRDKLKNVY